VGKNYKKPGKKRLIGRAVTESMKNVTQVVCHVVEGKNQEERKQLGVEKRR